MSTLAEIEIAAAGLPSADKHSLMGWLMKELSLEKTGDPEGPRVPGLGEGKWQVSDDFDAPLPDEFWLGREA